MPSLDHADRHPAGLVHPRGPIADDGSAIEELDDPKEVDAPILENAKTLGFVPFELGVHTIRIDDLSRQGKTSAALVAS